MKGIHHFIFWILAYLLLILIFGRLLADFIQSIYFVSFLFPVIVGTSWFYNQFLISGYLFKRKYFQFFLYFIYSLVISVYLEMLVLTLSMIVLVQYRFDRFNPAITDVFLLSIILYFFVFLNSTIILILKYFKGQEKLKLIILEKNKFNKGALTVRSSRKTARVLHEKIEYLESLGDYIKIHTSSEEVIITKEKISRLGDRLPENFLRIHRSFIVNRDKIDAWDKESVSLRKIDLPISRKYKQTTSGKLHHIPEPVILIREGYPLISILSGSTVPGPGIIKR